MVVLEENVETLTSYVQLDAVNVHFAFGAKETYDMEEFIKFHGFCHVTGYVSNLRSQSEEDAFVTLLKARSKFHLLNQFVTVFLWTLNPTKPSGFQTGVFDDYSLWTMYLLLVAFTNGLFPFFGDNDANRDPNVHLPTALIWSAVDVANWTKDPTRDQHR